MDLTKYRNKLVGSEDERAVSPVIGIILMVAITVILAAVIAAFVLDMGPDDPDPQAAMGEDQSGDYLEVEMQGTTDADGVFVWNGSTIVGEDDDEGILTTTGETYEFNHSDAYNNSIEVVAYSGSEPNEGEGDDELDELGLDNYAIVEEYDYDD
ncbi:type IV pilin [Natronolimnohabitans innermongolicus]|uniref:Archaeal Type IV pilin N-terminal domain-containing protein n=1 Tax=Natronolimnohabitans innermongolicus JCM 12255 TaxID=1227499 RepID=L9WVV5_9EURY|nr:type IV pilin N-terminal domain-containing protein [Natronolimnohabitans innermongolicus]ELY52478.1 hypothetical protein C493_15555 [Natronolimnohabitans innermongolicus JCM 12255]